MQNLKKFLLVFGLVLTIGLMVPSLFYIFNFWGGELSNDSQVWGTFGDYFGGVFNPVLALANLIIFIKITLIVANMQDISTQHTLIQEKKILMSGLMHDSIKELSNTLNTLGQRIQANQQQTDWEILVVLQTLNTFTNNYTHLFPEINSSEIVNELNHLVSIVRTKPYNKQDFIKSFDKYLNSKDQLIQNLHNQTINKLDI